MTRQRLTACALIAIAFSGASGIAAGAWNNPCIGTFSSLYYHREADDLIGSKDFKLTKADASTLGLPPALGRATPRPPLVSEIALIRYPALMRRVRVAMEAGGFR